MKSVVGFNQNRGIRSIAYKEDSSRDSLYVPLPIVQHHDRIFVNSSRFILAAESKIATLSDRRIYVWEGDEIVEEGFLEVNAVFSDPTKVSSYETDDTTQYPLPQELIPVLIKEVLKTEFNVMMSVPSNGPNNQSDEKAPIRSLAKKAKNENKTTKKQ